MKRLTCLFLAALLTLTLCACGGSPKPAGSSAGEGTAIEGGVSAESGLFNVTLTIPADFLEEGLTQADYDQEAEDAGWKSATLNDDGTVTYVMTKGQHKEMMSSLAASINDSLAEMVGDENYPNFVSITPNEDFTEFKIVSKSEDMGIAESFAVLGFYIYGGMYNAFNGTPADSILVKFVNESTGEVFLESDSSELG